MKVQELVAILQGLPFDTEVTVRSGDSSYAALVVKEHDGDYEILKAVDDSGWGD